MADQLPVRAYLSVQEIVGERIPVEAILGWVRRMGARPLFRRAAEFAAAISNREQPLQELEGFTRWAVDRLRRSQHPVVATLIGKLATRVELSRPLLHEKVLYLLQALALRHGTDSSDEVPDDAMALLALAVNDYASDWAADEPLPHLDKMVAEFCHLAHFNRGGSRRNELVRGGLIFRELPRHKGLSTHEEWRAFQAAALGSPFDDFHETHSAVLALMSYVWMDPNEPPYLNLADWGNRLDCGPASAREFLEGLTIGADEARQRLDKMPREGKLIAFPTFLFRTPLVRFDADWAVCASPKLIRHQLQFGYWGRCLAAAKRGDLGLNEGAWFSAFGDVFEKYCRTLVTSVESCRSFSRQPFRSVPSRLGEPDEIEDIVFVNESEAILVSCKSTLMREEHVRSASSRSGLVRWLEKFFFEEPYAGKRGGAFRLLDKKVSNIRAGRHEPKLDRDVKLTLLVVTYDTIGENLYLATWLRDRLAQKGLLQQVGVRGVLVLDIRAFESVLSLMEQGIDPSGLLNDAIRAASSAATLDDVGRVRYPDQWGKGLRLLNKAYQDLCTRMLKHFRDANSFELPALFGDPD